MNFKRFQNTLLFLAFLNLSFECAFADESPRCDLLLRNGIVHVGDGGESFQADIAILAGRIVAIGKDLKRPSNTILNCEGLVVSPGFIDLHTHSDEPILQRDTRANINYLLQGCTTSVTGNWGFGPIDVAKYVAEIDKEGAGTHIAHLLPHGSLRPPFDVALKRFTLPPNSQVQSAWVSSWPKT